MQTAIWQLIFPKMHTFVGSFDWFASMQQMIQKMFGKKGEDVIAKNNTAIQQAKEKMYTVSYSLEQNTTPDTLVAEQNTKLLDQYASL